MNKKKSIIISLITILSIIFGGVWTFKNYNFNKEFIVGEKIDSLNGVYVYYNGGVSNVTKRNTTKDGYNLGLKYQCVEFVKRYYFEYFNHKMPDSYGNAKDFINSKYLDGELNIERNLIQFSNPSSSKPKTNDLIVFSPTIWNRFGHVAIISKVSNDQIEIIQQNSGPYGKTREIFQLKKFDENWYIKNDRVLGWLRKNYK